ncbi:hypothetical protein [Metapseudomonas furukawaii]|uniref:hypothetical protein n=1 Tax=Metapseudomonas furukawaii TaxID=1149133 RepID=UPI00055CA9C4|nr:hypothetical protein [Pseudomonas furukawaii]
MTDLNDLRAALLAAVPVDGNTTGNQSLLERVRGQIPQLTEYVFWAARDGLIEEGVLAKGRDRSGAVRCTQAGADLPLLVGAAKVVAGFRFRRRHEPVGVAL